MMYMNYQHLSKIGYGLIASCILTFSSGTFGQDGSPKPAPMPKPRLVEAITSFKGDQSSMIIDRWRTEISRTVGSKGVVIVYCGQPCRYGEVEAHIRGIELALELKMDRNSFTIMHGWGTTTTTTEFWVFPVDSCPPIPENKVSMSEVKFRGKFPHEIIYYDCCY